jgi:hypothetical protein
VRIDAAEPYVFGLDRARGKLTPERHRGPLLRPPFSSRELSFR